MATCSRFVAAAAGGVAEATFDWQKQLPPGYRFKPSDDELVSDYLKKKVDNEPIPIKEISEVNLYGHNPEALAELYPRLGDNGWYFFTPRYRKYLKGGRPRRAAGTGYWKATGKDKPIEDEKGVVGYKKALVFYQGKPPKGKKTNWIMHEYTLHDQSSRNKRLREDNDMKLDEWVLCRIYEKVDRSSNKVQQKLDESSLSIDENVEEDNYENLEAVVGDQELRIPDNLMEHQSYNYNYQAILPDQPPIMNDYYCYSNMNVVGYEGNDLERSFNYGKEYYHPPGQLQESFVPNNVVNISELDQKTSFALDPTTLSSSAQQQVPDYDYYYSNMNVDGYEGNDLERSFNYGKEYYYPPGQLQESFAPNNVVHISELDQKTSFAVDPTTSSSFSQQQVPGSSNFGAAENNYIDDYQCFLSDARLL